jgi:hypothetical protein
VTSCKCIACFKAAQHGFPCMGSAAPKQIDIETCHVLDSAGQKAHALEHEPQNLSSFNEQPDMHFDTRAVRTPKHIPIQTCNVSRTMFQPHVPIFHVSPCDPHPCPMTNPWCFKPFSTSHCCCVFFRQILMSSSPFPHHRFT